MKHCTTCQIKMSKEEYEIFHGTCADCKAEEMMEALQSGG